MDEVEKAKLARKDSGSIADPPYHRRQCAAGDELWSDHGQAVIVLAKPNLDTTVELRVV